MTLQAELRDKTHSIIAPLIPPGVSRACLVDPPDHPNVGDSAIFLGEWQFFRRNFPSWRIDLIERSYWDTAVRAKLARADLILHHGGGNFGDLWWPHHQLRLKVMSEFQDIPQIQFPQSIHFDSAENLELTQRAIGGMRSFKLVVRDKASFAYARKHFDCEVVHCPDMAFSMEPPQARTAKYDYFCLLRTDKEKLVEKSAEVRDLLDASGFSYDIRDWIDRTDRRLIYPDRLAEWVVGEVKKRTVLPDAAYEFVKHLRLVHARRRVNRGLDWLGSGRTVITDRLHAHILSVILGREQYVFDSISGKVSAFYNDWTYHDPGTRFVTSIEELKSLVEAGHGD